MRRFRSPRERHQRVVPPDLEESRGNRRLLVWRDPPHWMVVDAEFAGFLHALNGSATWGELFEANPAWRPHERPLRAQIRRLTERRLVRDDGAEPELHRDAHVRSALRPIENIAIHVTKRCNLRCHFCYLLPQLTRTGDDRELSLEDTIAFLDQVRPHMAGKPSLSLLGGEPLLATDKVLALAAHARRRGWPCLVSTNGHLLSDKFAVAARRLGLQVQVSIDGHSEEHHDPIRGRGSFSQAIAGVRRLVEAGAHTILSCVYHRGNAGHLREFYRLAADLGVNEARFIPLKRMGGAQSGPIEPAPLTELLAEARRLFRENASARELAGRDAFSILAATCGVSAARTSCGTGEQTLLLDADGSIYPCLNLCVPALRVGNVRDAGFNFARLWSESPALARVRQETSIANPSSPCFRCAVRHWCLGGCHGETFATCGQLKDRACDCREQQESILEMMWLLAEDASVTKATGWTC